MNQDDFKVLFGKRFRQGLIEKGKRQNELVDLLEVSDKQISIYANGKGLPSVYNLMLICRELNISADFFLGLINEPTPLKNEEDPMTEELLIMRQSYAQMSDEMRAAFQSLVNTILSQKI